MPSPSEPCPRKGWCLRFGRAVTGAQTPPGGGELQASVHCQSAPWPKHTGRRHLPLVGLSQVRRSRVRVLFIHGRWALPVAPALQREPSDGGFTGSPSATAGPCEVRDLPGRGGPQRSRGGSFLTRSGTGSRQAAHAGLRPRQLCVSDRGPQGAGRLCVGERGGGQGGLLWSPPGPGQPRPQHCAHLQN